MGTHSYKNDRITVTWEKETCIHAAECVKNLQKVFDPQKKPWVNVDAASNEEIIAAIKKCPSGALAYQVEGEEQKSSPKSAKISVYADGPLGVSGVILEDGDGNVIEAPERFALCRCGASGNKPFCDNSHKKIGFTG